jgi:hypothetical protein
VVKRAELGWGSIMDSDSVEILKGTARSMAQKAVEGLALATAAWLRAAIDVDGPAARRAGEIADRRKTMRGTFLLCGELAARAGPSAARVLAKRRREIAVAARGQGAAHAGLGGLPALAYLLRAVLQVNCEDVGARPHPRKVTGGEIAATLSHAVALRARWAEH